MVNAKFDIGFPPTARKYEVVLVTRDPVGAPMALRQNA
jgi:hypothetical protein